VGSVTISQTNYRLYAYIAYVDPAAFDVLVKEVNWIGVSYLFHYNFFGREKLINYLILVLTHEYPLAFAPIRPIRLSPIFLDNDFILEAAFFLINFSLRFIVLTEFF
jgi:hypothetical protein